MITSSGSEKFMLRLITLNMKERETKNGTRNEVMQVGREAYEGRNHQARKRGGAQKAMRQEMEGGGVYTFCICAVKDGVSIPFLVACWSCI